MWGCEQDEKEGLPEGDNDYIVVNLWDEEIMDNLTLEQAKVEILSYCNTHLISDDVRLVKGVLIPFELRKPGK